MKFPMTSCHIKTILKKQFSLKLLSFYKQMEEKSDDETEVQGKDFEMGDLDI